MELGDGLIRKLFGEGIWKAYVDDQRVSIDDFVIGPNSIDVTLDSNIIIPTKSDGCPYVDSYYGDGYEGIGIDLKNNSGYYDLEPQEMILAQTRERFETNEPLVHEGETTYWKQNYEGRSTMARLGIGSHISAGFGDYGFNQRWTLEIVNHARYTIRLHPSQRIGQIYFTSVLGVDNKYAGGYSRNSGRKMVPSFDAHRLGVKMLREDKDG